MMKRILVIFCSFLPLMLQAQFGETIRTGRPGQAIGGFTLGKSVFQMQTGYNFNRIEQQAADLDVIVNNNVFRLGITEIFEVSGVINWQTESAKSDSLSTQVGGVSGTQLGARVNLAQNDGWLPTIGLQGRVLLKAQSEVYQRDKLGSTFIVATGNKLTDRLSMVTNWGLSWAGNDQNPRSFYVLNLSYGINERFGTFLEVYGNLEDFTANYDTGLSYLANDDFQLDFSTGWQGRDGKANWFIDMGLSWRLVWRSS